MSVKIAYSVSPQRFLLPHKTVSRKVDQVRVHIFVLVAFTTNELNTPVVLKALEVDIKWGIKSLHFKGQPKVTFLSGVSFSSNELGETAMNENAKAT